jgi:hypothetical protein
MWWTKAEMHAMARAEIERRRSATKEDTTTNTSPMARGIEAALLIVNSQAQDTAEALALARGIDNLPHFAHASHDRFDNSTHMISQSRISAMVTVIET